MKYFGLRHPLERSSLRYLSWYLLMLWLVMMAFTGVLIWQSVPIAYEIKFIILPVQGALTLVSFILLKRRSIIRSTHYLFVMGASLLLFTWYLYHTGGHTNPIISIFLVSLALCCTTLNWPGSTLIALLILLFYTGLTQHYRPLSVHDHNQEHHFLQFHLLGMWLTFLVSVALVLSLVLPLSLTLRRQQNELAQQREKILQDEKLVTIATFAASAAHKLGTPLSTLSILVEDCQDLGEPSTKQKNELDQMAQQIQICKQTLHDIMRKADDLRNDVQSAISINALLASVQEQFNLLHPQRALNINCQHLDGAVNGNENLVQAILNVIDNAVKHADDNPTLTITQQAGYLNLQIIDTGPGMPAAIREQLGNPFVPSGANGLGLGLYLSYATVNRLGGTLKITPSEQGTQLELQIPLTKEIA